MRRSSGIAIVTCVLAVLAARSGAQVPAALTPQGLGTPAATAPDAPRLRPAESIPPAELEAFVDGTVRLAMDQRHIAGVTVAIVQDGHVVLQKGYGFASFSPVRAVDPATTLFRIGSISKTFTWIEVMRAVETGKLDLDAPINNYLPPELQIPAQGFDKPIRMRDLMTHSPGFEDRVLGVLFAADPAKMLALDQFLERYRPRRVREPGVLSSYSNYGAALAGAVVQNLEGYDWQTLVERDILKPLNLVHITPREPYPARDGLPAPLSPELAAEMSAPMRWGGNAHVARGFEYVTPVGPAGAMSASAGDMARYMLLLLGDGTLDGVTIFGSQAARAFRTPLTSLPPEANALDAGFFDQLLPGGFHGYGHNGATLSFYSNMMVVPDLRLGVFVATNTEGGGELSDPLPGRIIERFYAPPRTAPKPASAEAAALREYAGEYVATRRRYEGLEGFLLSLGARQTVGVSPDGYLLAGPGAQRYVRAGPDLFAAVDPWAGGPPFLRFEREGGRVARIALVPIGFERVGALMSRSTLALAATLTLLTAVGIVIGALIRRGRRLPASSGQHTAGLLQLVVALLWLAMFVSAALVIAAAGDSATLVYHWPPLAILVASSLALAASVLTLAGVPYLSRVWLDSTRDSGWRLGRKIRYTLALAIFAALGVLLAMWGALVPWHY